MPPPAGSEMGLAPARRPAREGQGSPHDSPHEAGGDPGPGWDRMAPGGTDTGPVDIGSFLFQAMKVRAAGQTYLSSALEEGKGFQSTRQNSNTYNDQAGETMRQQPGRDDAPISLDAFFCKEPELPCSNWLHRKGTDYALIRAPSRRVGSWIDGSSNSTRDMDSFHLSSLPSPCWLHPKVSPKTAAAVPDVTSKSILSCWSGLCHRTIPQPMTGGVP